MTKLKPILYAEDDENDVFFMERAFEMLGIANPLTVLPDGKQVVSYLSRANPFQDREEPCLLILDLSIPGKHGLEVLKSIRSELNLAEFPVIILTSSNQDSDIRRAYQLGATGYIIKPGTPEELMCAVQYIKDYWLSGQRPAITFADFAVKSNVRKPKS